MWNAASSAAMFGGEGRRQLATTPEISTSLHHGPRRPQVCNIIPISSKLSFTAFTGLFSRGKKHYVLYIRNTILG